MATLAILSKSLNVDVNKKNHHTDMILDTYCLRRAQVFTLSITFNRPLQPTDNLKLNAVLMDYKRVKTLLNRDVPISDSTNKAAWSARKVSTGANNAVNFEIYSPANAVIGNYALNALTPGGNYNIGNFALLCNPWATDDSVYLSDSVKRKIYHDSTFTTIYRGSYERYFPLNWDLGQWEPGVVNICLRLLENTKDVSKRNNPIILCRDLSAIVNVQNDTGVLVGNWSGNYDDGTSPGTWNGSYRILSQYAEKNTPVKYGQCWVFAGVLCTVLRCLGIPSRVITNFDSAHDTDKNATLEKFFDYNGDSVDYSSDSIWNYHCWVDAWMSRDSDLGAAYSGWQAVDSTPQELSSGRYCCGPAPLKAVKEGQVDKPYDTLFVYSEVNSDVKHYYLNEDDVTTRITEYKSYVGRLTCTMALDMKSLENITLQYKYAEGSKQERDVHARALSIAEAEGGDAFRAMSPQAASAVAVPGETPVEGEIAVSENIHVGEDINASLNLKNKTDKSKEVNVTVNVKCMVYDALNSNAVKVEKQTITLEPNGAKSIPVKVPYAQYQKPLTPDNIVHVTVICDVKEEPTALIEKDINLKNPSVEIKVLAQAAVDKPFQVEVSFYNPLDGPVKNCVVTVEGSGLTSKAVVKNIASIAAKQKGVVQFDLTPTKPGDHILLVNFTCDRFKEVKGSQAINVP